TARPVGFTTGARAARTVLLAVHVVDGRAAGRRRRGDAGGGHPRGDRRACVDRPYRMVVRAAGRSAAHLGHVATGGGRLVRLNPVVLAAGGAIADRGEPVVLQRRHVGRG